MRTPFGTTTVGLILVILVLVSGELLMAQDSSPDMTRARERCRVVIREFLTSLKKTLQRELKTGGPVWAVAVCDQDAPRIASELSRRYGMSVRRVSLKTRNTQNFPDSWERVVLREFETRSGKGEDPQSLETLEIESDGEVRVVRYMKAIPTGALCLVCHGDPSDLDPDLLKVLNEKYPHDKAHGYAVGDIRGAFSLRLPLENETPA